MKIGRQNCAIPHQIQPTSTTVAGANNSNTVTNPNPITVMHTVSHTDTKLTENVCVEDKHGVPDDSHRVTTLIPVSAPDVLSQSYGVECAPIAGIGLDEAPGMAMLSAESVMVDHQDVLQLHIEHDFAADDTGSVESGEALKLNIGGRTRSCTKNVIFKFISMFHTRS